MMNTLPITGVYAAIFALSISPLAHPRALSMLGTVALRKLGTITPAAIRRIGQRNFLGITRVPSVFGLADFLNRRLRTAPLIQAIKS